MNTITLALVLASAAPDWGTSTIVQHAVLDDFIETADNGDYALALERIQQECDDLDGAGQTRGCTVKLSCGKEYELKTQVDICSSMRIEGCGTGRNLAGNVFKMTGDATAFRVWHKNETCPVAMDIDVNPHFTMEHVGIANYDTAQSAPMHGIDSNAPLFLSDVDIYGFTHGVHLDCDVTASPATGCSLTHVDGLWVRMNEHAGIYIAGGDTNAMNMVGVNAMQNCRYASEWNSTYAPVNGYCVDKDPTHPFCTMPCANIIEASFLGNSWIGPHTAMATDIGPNPDVIYPGFAGLGLSQQSAIIGLYTENDQLPSYMSGGSMAVEGQHSMDHLRGIDWDGSYVNGFIAKNDRLSSNTVETRIGRHTNIDGAYMSLANPEDPWELNIGYTPSTDLYYMSVDNGPQIKVRRQCSGGGGSCARWIMPDEIESPTGTCWEYDTATHVCD